MDGLRFQDAKIAEQLKLGRNGHPLADQAPQDVAPPDGIVMRIHRSVAASVGCIRRVDLSHRHRQVAPGIFADLGAQCRDDLVPFLAVGAQVVDRRRPTVDA